MNMGAEGPHGFSAMARSLKLRHPSPTSSLNEDKQWIKQFQSAK